MLQVSATPIFENNYVWVIHQPNGREVWVVDPGDANPVIKYLKKNSLTLNGLMITHSHYDHISGINSLLEYAPVPVVGPATEAIPQITKPLREGDCFDIWDAQITVFEVPGHMPEHLCFWAQHHGDNQIFCGDTLFSSGCGRIFNGTHCELKQSLDRIKGLPKDTLVYCAHEYTLANLAFARTVEPENPKILERENAVLALRKTHRPSLPSSIGLELEVNPFLRCNQRDVVAAVAKQLKSPPRDELEVFTTLRRWKDHF